LVRQDDVAFLIFYEYAMKNYQQLPNTSHN